ncbi:MAG: nucleoside-diphosphate-sugar epimerase [Paracoccaceae bacterium]|jgi:nucleoside-diphosphate-sugar epimerase
MTQTVLILGATGRFGRNAAQQFQRAGWVVRCFDRSHDDLTLAAQGADVIVNAWNPPYWDWAAQTPRQHRDVQKVAKQVGATVIIPGNVYVFGKTTPGPWSQDAPHHAQNALGKIRIDMEASYRVAGVRTIILRAGDFLDTQASGNWFDLIMIKSLTKGVFTYPGDPSLSHSWAFLPDLCRAAVELAEMRDDLPVFSDVPFPGYTLTGTEMHNALDRVTPNKVRLKRMSWLPLQIAKPFWRMASTLLEMRYLWNTPHSLDGAKFRALLPGFKSTPLNEALMRAGQLT